LGQERNRGGVNGRNREEGRLEEKEKKGGELTGKMRGKRSAHWLMLASK